MQATNADSPRHPASLTKIMTLYLLFERLEQGKIKLTTEMPVSAHAAAQAPSKLGLKPGETIRVETAIRAIVTKSANDVAVIVAEALGGDEPSFAKLDDRKGARARYDANGLSQRVRSARATNKSQPRAIRLFSAAPFRIAFRITTTISRRGRSISAANRSETTIICLAPLTAWTASRPVIFATPDSTSSRRFAAPIVTSWRSYSAAALLMRATRGCEA